MILGPGTGTALNPKRPGLMDRHRGIPGPVARGDIAHGKILSDSPPVNDPRSLFHNP
jgi:hypothetical protein